jgi:hypothetical protein
MSGLSRIRSYLILGEGMTLDYAQIDLSKVFQSGQGYVALSRVRTMKGLQIIRSHRSILF